MENPVYKLEKVVRTRTEEMRDFEGPLDLILFLLSKNKMEIQDISVALICDQYVAWLQQRRQMDLEVASEFVTMASHLVYLKTRMLLSLEDEEAKTEMDALIQSLEERRRHESYAKIRQAAKRLEPMEEFGRRIETRGPEPMERGKIYEYRHQPADLVLALAEIQNRAERKMPPPKAAFAQIVQREPYPVETKARDILRHLKQGACCAFCSSSGAAAAAVRWWPPSSRCWSSARRPSSVSPVPSRTAPSSSSGTCRTTSHFKEETQWILT